MDRLTVILTSCIAPSGFAPAIKRQSIAERYGDYEAAVRFWLACDCEIINRVIYIDNSSHPLIELERYAAACNPLKRQIIFRQLLPSTVPLGVSYGYSELEMLDSLVGDRLLFNDDDYLVKATGRLTFEGVNELVRAIPQTYRFVVDARNDGLFRIRRRRFVPTQLMFWNVGFYRDNIYGIHKTMAGRWRWIEDLLYERLIRYRRHNGCIFRFPVSAEPRGVAAHNGRSYLDPGRRIAGLIRRVGRRHYPWWWM